MLSFYTIVIIIAIIILVIALTIIGVTLTNKKNNIEFPDYQHACPDFWTLDSSGNRCKPTNDINIPLQVKVSNAGNHSGVGVNSGKTKIEYIDLSEDNWVSVCDKASWAKKAGILWDGVTNNNTCA
jgi:hypothetical protein